VVCGVRPPRLFLLVAFNPVRRTITFKEFHAHQRVIALRLDISKMRQAELKHFR
jgi:hypothetical protein